MKALSAIIGFSVLLLFVSCSNKVVPLKGTYPDKPYQFAIASSKKQVWNKLIDLLTAEGLAIKTIDENSGLITTDPTSFLNSYSFENEDGSLTNPAARVVCSKVRGPLTFPPSLKPVAVAGQWTLRVKEEADKTIVAARLANAFGKVEIQYTDNTKETFALTVVSTGAFEKKIEEALQ